MTHPEYSRRMNRVLDHIDQHLDTPLELDDLAAIANFSTFHFHRVFSAWLGETLGTYLSRRRLEVGAMRLANRVQHSNLDHAGPGDFTNHQEPAKNIAYMRCIGVHGNAIADFWNGVFGPWSVAHGLDDKPRYGVVRDDPSITPPDQCRYDCCVEIPDGFVPSKEIAVGTLPGGKYVAAQFQGTASMIANGCPGAFGALPESGGALQLPT